MRKAHVHQVGIVQTSLDLPLAMGETFAGVPVRVTGEENALISIKMFGATGKSNEGKMLAILQVYTALTFIHSSPSPSGHRGIKETCPNSASRVQDRPIVPPCE